jgi:putative DNA primase/helicase
MRRDGNVTYTLTKDDLPPDDSPEPFDVDDHHAGEYDTAEVKHSGHLGKAVKLAKQFANQLLYVNKIGWHRWDGARWAVDNNGAARRAVHTLLARERALVAQLELAAEEEEKWLKDIGRYETAAAISGILTEAAALQAFSVTTDDINGDPWLFNCANGTLDLRTGELGPHNPADRITKISGAAYREGVISQRWDTFLQTVLPDDDVRNYLQRVLGLSLLGEVNGDKQIAPIAHGAGNNGKTTLIEAVLHALGDYAMPAEPSLLMTRRGEVHPTGVADLLGKRLVATTETQEGARFDLALLKRLTGGDTLKARLMRQDFFQFDPSHLLIMATNHLPEIEDGTEAVWRRIRVIPFAVQIPPEDREPGLRDWLRADADAVMTWIVCGWNEYRRSGLNEPPAVMMATGEYQSESDAVGRFIEDECHAGSAQASATTSTLYRRWENWAAKNGCTAMSRIAFGRALDAKGYPADQNTHDRLRHRISLKERQDAGQ